MKPTRFALVVFLIVTVALMLIHPVFATEWLNDGFEDNTFDAWTGTSTSTGETLTIVQTDPHHGDDHAKSSTDGDAVWESAYAYLNLNENQTVYSRGYFKFKDLPTTSGERITIHTHRGNSQNIARFCAYHNGTHVIWRLIRLGGSNDGTSAISVDTYYCVEAYSYVDGTNGAHALWINGEQEISYSGFDNDANGNVDDVWMGITESNLATPKTVDLYWDCCIIADTYIGEEAAGEEHNFFGVINAQFTLESTLTWSVTKGGIINQVWSITSTTDFAQNLLTFLGEINQLFSLASYRTWSFRVEGTINPTFSIESIIQIVPSILNFYGHITQSFQIVQWNDLKPEINLALIVAAFALIMAIIGITFAVVKKK